MLAFTLIGKAILKSNEQTCLIIKVQDTMGLGTNALNRKLRLHRRWKR